MPLNWGFSCKENLWQLNQVGLDLRLCPRLVNGG
nr:MAG TPA: hypothetical protein [Caudoviricetes sp.]